MHHAVDEAYSGVSEQLTPPPLSPATTDSGSPRLNGASREPHVWLILPPRCSHYECASLLWDMAVTYDPATFPTCKSEAVRAAWSGGYRPGHAS